MGDYGCSDLILDSWVDIRGALVQLKVLSESMAGEEIARELISVCFTSYHINSNHLLAKMRDWAFINNVAVRTVKILYPHIFDVGCFSHIMNFVGELVLRYSSKAQLLWKQQKENHSPLILLFGGEYVGSYEAAPGTVLGHWALAFSGEDFATALKLLAMLEDPEQNRLLQLELAATTDVGEPFPVQICLHSMQTTYRLDRDRPFAQECFEVLIMGQASVRNHRHLLINTVARQLSVGNSVAMTEMIQYAMTCVQPGVHYFATQLESNLKEPLLITKLQGIKIPIRLLRFFQQV